jgi:hypothetical protein
MYQLIPPTLQPYDLLDRVIISIYK